MNTSNNAMSAAFLAAAPEGVTFPEVETTAPKAKGKRKPKATAQPESEAPAPSPMDALDAARKGLIAATRKLASAERSAGGAQAFYAAAMEAAVGPDWHMLKKGIGTDDQKRRAEICETEKGLLRKAFKGAKNPNQPWYRATLVQVAKNKVADMVAAGASQEDAEEAIKTSTRDAKPMLQRITDAYLTLYAAHMRIAKSEKDALLIDDKSTAEISLIGERLIALGFDLSEINSKN